MTQDSSTLEYQEKPRTNRWVMGVFIASLVAVAVFFFVVPAVVVLVAAIGVRSVAQSRGIGGMGLANAAVRISAWSTAIGVISLLATPMCACGSHELSNRSVCGANLRGIVQSMNVYAADNGGRFPIISFAPYLSIPNGPAGYSTGTTNADAALRGYFGARHAQAGSAPACLWMMVVDGQVNAKQFVCKSDPYGSGAAPATDGAGSYFNNFQSGGQLSYSIAYPWNAAGEPGAWWKDDASAEVALIADMAPKQGTGTPARDLTPAGVPADKRTWNSSNHEGDGQNVGFADGHAEFTRGPDVGPRNDNIYSMSGNPSKGPVQFGGIPAGAMAPNLAAEKGPWDIIMLPVRDETTGKM